MSTVTENYALRPLGVGAPSTQDTQGNPEMGKDAFLKLMMTQMANQDPTAPQDSQQMATQLAHLQPFWKPCSKPMRNWMPC